MKWSHQNTYSLLSRKWKGFLVRCPCFCFRANNRAESFASGGAESRDRKVTVGFSEYSWWKVEISLQRCNTVNVSSHVYFSSRSLSRRSSSRSLLVDLEPLLHRWHYLLYSLSYTFCHFLHLVLDSSLSRQALYRFASFLWCLAPVRTCEKRYIFSTSLETLACKLTFWLAIRFGMGLGTLLLVSGFALFWYIYH